MKKLISLLIIIFLINFNCYSQSFKENSIGIVYLTGETETEYEVDIVFLFESLTNYSIESPLLEIREVMDKFETDFPIILFDENGKLLKIQTKNTFEIVFWCENDAGIQFRPTLKLKLQKKSFDRNLKANNELQNIVCFSLINQNSNTYKGEMPNESSKEDVRMEGDMNNDGILEARIWVRPDDTQNCDGLPENNLEIFLGYNGCNHWIRCCGP